MDEKKVNSELPAQVGVFFNKISIGLLLLKKEPPQLVFANPFFYRMAMGREDDIVNTIFKDIEESEQKNTFRCDIDFEDGFVVGYTIYRLGENEYLVFLNNITHKKIYFENKGENRFYDRLSHLLAEVVHEIGNPLTALTTTLQVLSEYISEWDTEKKKEYLQRSIDEIDRLSNYLDRMRNFSRIVSAQPGAISLRAIIQRVIMQNHDLLAKRHILVSWDVPENQQVVVDEELFYQVLLNLFVNSLEILPLYGKISLTVEEVNEFFVILAYRNNGPAIPPEFLDKIFIPFFSTKKNGSGIGLAVSLKLMTRMGGAMRVETPEKDWGVKFVLFIPVNEDGQFGKQVSIRS